MPDSPADDLLARIQALPPEERARVVAQLGLALPSAPAVSMGSSNQVGDVTMGDTAGRDVHKGIAGGVALSDDARLNGVAVGVNLGIIIYGRSPAEDERRQLAWYLARLSNTLYRLSLRGLEDRLDKGAGMALPQIYTALAVQHTIILCDQSDQLTPYFRDGKVPERGPDHRETYDQLLEAYHPQHALPMTAVITMEWDRLLRVDQSVDARLVLYRHALATEVIADHHHLVLLAAPGGGKSTLLRHLAWTLAQHGLDQHDAVTALVGWNDAPRLLPIILPLRALAGRIAAEGALPRTMFAALCAELQTYCIAPTDALLNAALGQGSAMLLCDGLDEVPLAAVAGQSADRATTLAVVRAFATMHPAARIVVTCRSRAFTDDLRDQLGWPVEILAPFTLGQVRHFVPAWYSELVAKQQITEEQAERLSASLVESIVGSVKLTEMAQTPLLLTMMALVLFNKGELPRDRPQLYEKILALLLGQWDQVHEGQSLATAIGLPDWGSERFQPLLDQLSFTAHLAGSSVDGLGRLGHGDLYLALITFFKAAQVLAPGDTALRWLDYVEQRSGLLAPDGPDSYVFAHLTLQEHCAGRHLALNSENPVALALSHRADDRWREPIFLGAGLMHPAVLNALLSDLIEHEGKDAVRWYRDLILAAELGYDRDWSYLRTRPMVKVDHLQRDLKHGLAVLLNDATQPLPVAERVRAGFLLGELGDPRYPVTAAQWQTELARAGQPGSYFCQVQAGAYVIGSRDDDPDADDNETPQHSVTFEQPFLMARHPITNDQWQAWVAQEGEASIYADDGDLNHPNQPVVGVRWETVNRFCVWLSEQLGVTVRLPREEEWEAAARGGDARRYPWGDEWRDDHAASEENKAARGWDWSVPVGCFPSGAAPCGALDLAGNVWEWTADTWQSYPGAEKQFTEEDRQTVRGGYFDDARTNVRCGARDWVNLDDGNLFIGFRLVVAPPLAH